MVASKSSSVGGTGCLMDRSYQRSATIPCWDGQAPVASVAMAEEEKVLASWKQLLKTVPFSASLRKPPGERWGRTGSR